MSFFRFFAVLSVSLTLVACVTTTDSRFTKKESAEKAEESYVALGLGYLNAGDLKLARIKLDRALALEPDSPSANAAMGLYWQRRDEPRMAEQFFKKSLDEDSDYVAGHYYYGRFLMTQKRGEEALPHLEIAAQDVEYNGRIAANEDLGLCYFQMKRRKDAYEAFAKAWKLNPDSTVATLNLAILYLEDKDFDQSNRWYQRFERTIQIHNVPQSAASLWTGIQLARALKDKNREYSYAKLLKQNFSKSAEYKLYSGARRR